MLKILFKNFSFSWRVTLTCLLLSLVMFRLSHWQWERYLKKVELVESYEKLSSSTASPLPLAPSKPEAYDPLLDQQVTVRGRYDYERQLIVTNKKSGEDGFSTIPGHHLFTPFLIDGGARAIMVSRGFVPFEDRVPETWRKYDFSPAEEELHGVLKRSISPWLIGPKNPQTGSDHPFATRFFFEEIPKMAAQLPYPVITEVYIQRLGKPPTGLYPKEAVTIEVPPSTHYGYTLEWAALGIFTITVGFLLQVFPHYRGFFAETPPPDERVLH